jgi:hypothetical protein
MGLFIGIIIGLVIVYILVRWGWNWFSSRLRDKAAHDALADFDFNKEEEEIRSFASKYLSKECRCPKCNGMLVIRKGIYGEFLGCNHYPDCKYTRSL